MRAAPYGTRLRILMTYSLGPVTLQLTLTLGLCENTSPVLTKYDFRRSLGKTLGNNLDLLLCSKEAIRMLLAHVTFKHSL